MKTPSLFLIFLVSFIICACEVNNPWMEEVLETKTVTFNSNGGSHVPSQKLYKGQTAERPADPVKSSSGFLGWYADNETFAELYNFDFIPIHDMTLYAKWDDSQEFKSDPVAGDFDIEGAGQFDYDGNPKNVTVAAKTGKTTGEITVYYQQLNSAASVSPPILPGAYSVTFNVKAADGWNAADGLSAGTLIINTPSAFSGISDLERYLSLIPVNTIDDPYIIKLNIANEVELAELKRLLLSSPEKYVFLDLSGSTIEIIPENAFNDRDLSDVNNPVFLQCYSLTGIIIPDSVIWIGGGDDSNDKGSFQGCVNLTSVTIGNNVEGIGTDAFRACEKLTAITIPKSVASIGERAFYYCLTLTRVTFEGTLSQNGFSSYAFDGDLRTVFYANNNQDGTSGTYTTSSPVTASSIWSKQP